MAVPDPPVLNTVVATSDTEIDLDWTAGPDGGSPITGYKIERNLNAGGWATLVADTASTDTDYTDSTLSTGDQADYRISAINAEGTSTASNVLGATTFTVPDAPTAVEATVQSDTDVLVEWTAPVDNGGTAITGYKIESNVDSAGWTTLVADTGNTDTDYTDTSLSAGESVIYRISAINSVGLGAASTASDPVVTFTVPDAPVLDTVVATSDTEIDLDWTAPVDDGGSAVTGYKIESNVDGGGWTTLVADTGTTATTYTDNSLSAGEQVDYRISAINSVGASAASNVLGDTTFNVPDAPELALDTYDETTITVTWDTPADNDSPITGYKVIWSDDNFSTSDDETVDDLIHELEITGLDTGTQYKVKVRAINAIGESADSNVITQDTGAPLLAYDSYGTPITKQNNSFFYKEGTSIVINDTVYEVKAIFLTRNVNQVLINISNTHASNALVYKVMGIIHASDNTPPEVDEAGLKLWAPIHTDISVAGGVTDAKTVEAPLMYDFILIAFKAATPPITAKVSIKAK